MSAPEYGKVDEMIRDIQIKIQQNRFPNEASISQGIVLRIIRSLGWNVDDIDVVWPEFATGSQRADYALCHPAAKPLVLIEVKQPGTMSVHAEEQLAGYAFQEGVPLVILTSGQDWHFYAPYGPGQFSDRRIYRLDLLERTSQEAEERFRRYLSFDSWTNGRANLAVQEDLREMLGKQETRRKLPEAWQALLSEPNAQLVELLTAQLEKQSGSEPPKGEVVLFLKSLSIQHTVTPTPSQATSRREQKPLTAKANPPVGDSPSSGSLQPVLAAGSIRLWIAGEEVPVSNHKDRFVKVINHLVSKDPVLPSRFSHIFKEGQRPTFAKSPQDLFPKAPHLANTKSNWVRLATPEAWYLDLNKSAATFRSLIDQALSMVPTSLAREIRLG